MGAALDHARRLLAAVDDRDVLTVLEQQTATFVNDGPSVPSTRSVGARWWCSQCFSFVQGESSPCSKCRHAGPHDFGEESNAPGFDSRRDRLKREQRKKKGRRR